MTIAAWLVMTGSVFVVLTAFDQIAAMHSLETREAVEDFLSKPPGEDLGLGVQGMLSVMRVLTMVTAACATAAAILGYQVLQRSRSARLVLTVLAAPLFLAGMVVGGFLPAVIVGSIVMLWFQPARDWIDGKAPRVVPAAPEPAAAPGGDAARRPAAPPRAGRGPTRASASRRAARSTGRPRPDPRSTRHRRLAARLGLRRWCGPARWPGRAPRSCSW